MRSINITEIKKAVEEAVLNANTHLPEDIVSSLQSSLEKETSKRARFFLKTILENAELAACEGIALCQDTGMERFT